MVDLPFLIYSLSTAKPPIFSNRPGITANRGSRIEQIARIPLLLDRAQLGVVGAIKLLLPPRIIKIGLIHIRTDGKVLQGRHDGVSHDLRLGSHGFVRDGEVPELLRLHVDQHVAPGGEDGVRGGRRARDVEGVGREEEVCGGGDVAHVGYDVFVALVEGGAVEHYAALYERRGCIVAVRWRAKIAVDVGVVVRERGHAKLVLHLVLVQVCGEWL